MVTRAATRDEINAYNRERLPNGRTRGSEYQMRLYEKKKVLISAYKHALGCRVCGEADPVVLDLHHRDEAEKHELLRVAGNRGRATQAWRQLSYEVLRAELSKCDVLCANCHRRETYRRRQA